MRFLTINEKLGRPECPYLIRWAINFGPLGSLRLHHWIRSDDKRAKHDHPSDFITLVLKGAYADVGTKAAEYMAPGMIRRRKAEHAHYVHVYEGGCWTLLYFWPKRRNWGFYRIHKGKIKWTKANKYFLEEGHHPCDQL